MSWDSATSTPKTIFGGRFSGSTYAPLRRHSSITGRSFSQNPYCLPPPEPESPGILTPQPQDKVKVISFEANPSIISPTNDGVRDSLTFSATVAVRPTNALQPQRLPNEPDNHHEFFLVYTIEITQSTSTVMKLSSEVPIVLPLRRGGANMWFEVPFPIPWDGKTSLGKTLSDGAYNYTLTVDFIRRYTGPGGKQAQSIVQTIGTAKTLPGTLVIDTSAPQIAILSPQDNEILTTRTPEIVVEYCDHNSDLELASFSASLNGNDISDQFNVSVLSASWNGYPELQDGAFGLVVKIMDQVGNVGKTGVRFSILSGSAQTQYQTAFAFLQALAPLYGFPSDLHDLDISDYNTIAAPPPYIIDSDVAKLIGHPVDMSTRAASYLNFQQVVNGRKVFKAILTVSLDDQGNPTDIFGDYFNDIPGDLPTMPTIDFPTGLQIALSDQNAQASDLIRPATSELYIFRDSQRKYHLAGMINLSLPEEKGGFWLYIIDTQNGSILIKTQLRLSNYITGNGSAYEACGNGVLSSSVPLDYLIDGGHCQFGICNALYGKYAGIVDNLLPFKDRVLWNASNAYYFNPDSPDTNEQLRFNEVNAYYNITRSAQYYLNRYGYELDKQSGAPYTEIQVNKPNSDWSGHTSIEGTNSCWIDHALWGSSCSGGFSVDIYLYMDPPTTPPYIYYSRDLETAFHEYNHAVHYNLGGFWRWGHTEAYDEGDAQFYGAFKLLDMESSCPYFGGIVPFVYPFDYDKVPCGRLPAGDSHCNGLFWTSPLLRMRQWAVDNGGNTGPVYDNAFHAIPRIGLSFDFHKGLLALLAAEDNTRRGTKVFFYDTLASFAQNGIQAPDVFGKTTGIAIVRSKNYIYDFESSSDLGQNEIAFEIFAGSNTVYELKIATDPSLLDYTYPTVNNFYITIGSLDELDELIPWYGSIPDQPTNRNKSGNKSLKIKLSYLYTFDPNFGNGEFKGGGQGGVLWYRLKTNTSWESPYNPINSNIRGDQFLVVKGPSCTCSTRPGESDGNDGLHFLFSFIALVFVRKVLHAPKP